MGNCICSKNKFIKTQMRDEYRNRKVNMSFLGKYKPKQVFIGDELKLISIIPGLNSLCECDIHISIGNNPTRIILSYVDYLNDSYMKGQTFHIYKIIYKEITTIEDINQYDIYNSIQDYIFINKQEPKNDKYSVAI